MLHDHATFSKLLSIITYISGKWRQTCKKWRKSISKVNTVL